MTNPTKSLGGIIHAYQRFDPVNFPPPTQPPADMVSPAFEHMLQYGNTRDLTEEELARAIRLDPSQIKGLGPSIASLKAILEAQKRKILSTYETDTVKQDVQKQVRKRTSQVHPPGKFAKDFHRAAKEEDIEALERLWYKSSDGRDERQDDFALDLLRLIESIGERYQIEDLAQKYAFTGEVELDIPGALEVKETLETIDRLLKQLEEAEKTAQIGVIDMDALARFTEPEDIESLGEIEKQIQDLVKKLAEEQGLVEAAKGGFDLTPKAHRLFQSKLLSKIFADLSPSKTGRHDIDLEGDGAVELPVTRPYEYGDSVSQLDIPQSFVNALVRRGNTGETGPIRIDMRDMVIHTTRNKPKCATAVLLDMSGSMRYDGMYMNVKRMGMALEGLIRSEYPGDFLQFIEMYTVAKARPSGDLASLMPKPVTIYDPVVRLKADMSKPNITEEDLPPHFTNIQHALQLARRFLSTQDTPNRQILVITDGLPTAHFEGKDLFMLYPPDPRTENATLREAKLCAREGIVVNLFLLSTWNQTEDDVRFAYRLAESTKGRVFFTAGRELDRFVVWDYLARKRSIIS